MVCSQWGWRWRSGATCQQSPSSSSSSAAVSLDSGRWSLNSTNTLHFPETGSALKVNAGEVCFISICYFTRTTADGWKFRIRRRCCLNISLCPPLLARRVSYKINLECRRYKNWWVFFLQSRCNVILSPVMRFRTSQNFFLLQFKNLKGLKWGFVGPVTSWLAS